MYPICQDLTENLSRVTSNVFSTLHSPVQSTEGGSLVFLHVYQQGN